MQNETLKSWLTGGPLLIDGGWGTEFQKRGLPLGAHPDLWNLENPDAVKAVAKSYVDAGSDIILTNTFGSSRFVLANHGAADKVAEINRRGVELSKEAAEEATGRKVRVLASVGPTGVMLALGDVSPEEVYAAFVEQIEAQKAGGADGVVVETSSDPQEMALAVKAAKSLGLLVVASGTFDSGKKKDRTMMGATPESFAQAAEEAGADAVGSNCGRGIETFVEICSRMKAVTTLPLWMKGNAGLPKMVDGATVYDQTPEGFAAEALKVVAEGASFVGGCCGSNPAFIAAVRAALDAR